MTGTRQQHSSTTGLTLVIALVLTGGAYGTPAEFRRGDANGSGDVELGDAIVSLGHLFGGVHLACSKAADANDDGRLAITHVVALLDHLFLGNGPVPPPYPDCGLDPTADGLTCDDPSGCEQEDLRTHALALHVTCDPCDCAIEDASFQSAEGGCKDLAASIVWTRGPPGGWSWAATRTVLESLESGGFSDWRLPTVAELQDLAANGKLWHLQAFQGHLPCNCGFWSSEERGSRAWRVLVGGDDRNGEAGLVLKASYMNLLFVREGIQPPSNCGNSTCDPGEDCGTCSDCAGQASGPPSQRFCCGDGVTQGPEANDPRLCDGNN